MKIKIILCLYSLLLIPVSGVNSYPTPAELITETGMASYYSDIHEGKKTASGEIYKKADFTAAHRTLPFGTEVKVTNVSTGKSVTVRVNDRGPFSKSRIIDLSRAAATELGIIKRGIAKVSIAYEKIL